MPVKEREKLFAVIARQGFEKDIYTHAEMFDGLGSWCAVLFLASVIRGAYCQGAEIRPPDFSLITVS
ncbi:MAG: hypothetical protein M0Z61_13330 [Nitrospiraceae bacterium]|nr:hypothetical protein [Nitrospiraceae bacterium]